MAFRDTKKNNGYHSLFIKLFWHVKGGGHFFRLHCYKTFTDSQFMVFVRWSQCATQMLLYSDLLLTRLVIFVTFATDWAVMPVNYSPDHPHPSLPVYHDTSSTIYRVFSVLIWYPTIHTAPETGCVQRLQLSSQWNEREYGFLCTV